MNREAWISTLWAWLLAALGALGAIGCLVTGMDVANINMWLMSAVCVASALVFSVCIRHKWGLLPLGGCALAVGYFWRKGSLALSAEALAEYLTFRYDGGYGWGVLRWSDADLTGVDMTAALCVLAVLTAAVIAWSVLRTATALPALVAMGVSVAACMVVTDTVPDGSWLFCVLAVMLLLLLTQSMRRRSVKDANRLLAYSVLPVLLALALLFSLVPRKGYDQQAGAQKLEDWVLSWFTEEAPAGPPARNNPALIAQVSAQSVDLRTAGPQSYRLNTVMELIAYRAETVYLRACAFDTYSGSGWSATEGRWALEGDYPIGREEPSGVELITKGVHDVRYISYMPLDIGQLEGGRIKNTDRTDIYSILYTPVPSYNAGWDSVMGGVTEAEMSQYLTLPQQTLTAAQAYLRRNLRLSDYGDSAGEQYRLACDIVELVKNTVPYDLKTPRMPQDEDFAMWFLTEAETGYCVHFATATAVLMRAAGLPAVYVTGYLVDVPETSVPSLTDSQYRPQFVTVKDKDAHAWIECYINGIGWLPMEPTPAGEGSAVGDVEQDATVDPTQPETQPTETTEETTVQTTVPETTEPAPTQTQPQQTPGQTEEKRAAPIWLLYLALILAVPGQWQLRVWLDRRARKTGPANRRALAAWGQLDRAYRLLHRKASPELYTIAQKARFSQHSVTPQELNALGSALKQAHRQLKSQPLLKQLYYCLILAIY